MTKGSISKLLLAFTIPMFIGSVFQQLYNVVDRMIVGRFIGEKALASVGASFSINFLLIALVLGATMGISVLVAQYYGAKDNKKLRLCIETAYIFTAVLSLALMLIGFVSSDFIFQMLKTPQEILADAKIYLNTLFAGMILFVGYNLVSSILRGLGDSRTPLYLLVVSTIVNIVLDLIFVIFFNWGVFGAAFATIISQGVSFIGGLYYLQKIRKLFRVNYFRLRFDKGIFVRSIQIGLPTGIQQILVVTGMMVLQRLVNGYGTDALAAYTAAGSIDSFAMMPAMNLSMALSTFVGQNIGAQKQNRVNGAVKAGLLMATLIAIVVSLCVVTCGKWLLFIFTDKPEVIALGQDYLRIVGSFYLPFMLMFIFTGCLRGAGDTIIPTIFTILSLWIIRVPIATFLAGQIGINGIWWAMPVSWLIGLIMSAVYFYSGAWSRDSVIKISPKDQLINELGIS